MSRTKSRKAPAYLKEIERLELLTRFEKAALSKGYRTIAGVDEAGRGPLAGPVVAAACILTDEHRIIGVNDSKKLAAHNRESIFDELTEDETVYIGIGVIDADVIDRINIYQATICAMLMAVKNLLQPPDYLLVDGLQLAHPSIFSEKIIKGDSLSQSIAAASIIAKVTRDRLMMSYHRDYPEYGFDTHKGYGTTKHLLALEVCGLCPIHRKSFAPCRACQNQRVDQRNANGDANRDEKMSSSSG